MKKWLHEYARAMTGSIGPSPEAWEQSSFRSPMRLVSGQIRAVFSVTSPASIKAISVKGFTVEPGGTTRRAATSIRYDARIRPVSTSSTRAAPSRLPITSFKER